MHLRPSPSVGGFLRIPEIEAETDLSEELIGIHGGRVTAKLADAAHPSPRGRISPATELLPPLSPRGRMSPRASPSPHMLLASNHASPALHHPSPPTRPRPTTGVAREDGTPRFTAPSMRRGPGATV